MNKREVLERIIEREGSCQGIRCKRDNCPFYTPKATLSCSRIVNTSNMVDTCKQMLAELEKEEVKVKKFNAGDLVFCLLFGWGKVDCEDNNSESFCVVDVSFFNHVIGHFTKDGKLMAGHKHPILFTREEAEIKFPEYPAPKKKVKKNLERWANVYPGGEVVFFREKHLADMHEIQVVSTRVDCVKVEVHYEVEE